MGNNNKFLSSIFRWTYHQANIYGSLDSGRTSKNRRSTNNSNNVNIRERKTTRYKRKTSSYEFREIVSLTRMLEPETFNKLLDYIIILPKEEDDELRKKR